MFKFREGLSLILSDTFLYKNFQTEGLNILVFDEFICERGPTILFKQTQKDTQDNKIRDLDLMSFNSLAIKLIMTFLKYY